MLHRSPRPAAQGARPADHAGAAHHRHRPRLEDLSDHDDLRHDPLLALLADTLEGRRRGCAPLAGKSTLQRLEHAPAGGKPGRYDRIDHDPAALQAVLVESFIEHITCGGGRPLFALLRPGNSDPAAEAIKALCRVIPGLRREWPRLKILVRADSAYAREELLAWCEDNRVDYVIGVAKNARLTERNRRETGRRPGRSRPPQPPRTPVRRVPPRHAEELVAAAVGRRQGGTPAGQGQPPLRRHLTSVRLGVRRLPDLYTPHYFHGLLGGIHGPP